VSRRAKDTDVVISAHVPEDGRLVTVVVTDPAVRGEAAELLKQIGWEADSITAALTVDTLRKIAAKKKQG
jgi:high-affinity K+ transport system ATPase subunit B